MTAPPHLVAFLYTNAAYSVASYAIAIALQQESQALLPGLLADESR